MAPKTVKIRITGKVNVNGENGEELQQYEESKKDYDVSPLFARDLCARGIASACSQDDADVIDSFGHLPGGVTITSRDPVVSHRDPSTTGGKK